MRRKRKTTRQLKMASSRRGRGWHLLHHLLHPLFQHQHHHLHPPRLQHCHFHQLLPLQSKQSLWHLRLLWLRAPKPTSWRTPRAPPRLTYQLEGVLLQTPPPQTPHQSGMKVLTTLQFLSLNPRRRHHAKKHLLSNQLKKVAAKTNNEPTRCLHKQTSLLRSRGCGSTSQQS